MLAFLKGINWLTRGEYMKKIVSVTIFIVAGFIVFFLTKHQQGTDETYLLPSGFEGCVVIYYDVEGAPPLKLENNEIVYRVHESGVIETSSPSNIGWASEHGSGSYKLSAYYVDEKGVIIEELPQEKIRFGGMGSYQEEGKPKQVFSHQIFGSKETEDKGCPKLDI